MFFFGNWFGHLLWYRADSLWWEVRSLTQVCSSGVKDDKRVSGQLLDISSNSDSNALVDIFGASSANSVTANGLSCVASANGEPHVDNYPDVLKWVDFCKRFFALSRSQIPWNFGTKPRCSPLDINCCSEVSRCTSPIPLPSSCK